MRLLLYINGILAIKTEPLDSGERMRRIMSWKRIYGDGVKIEVVAV